MTKIFTWIRFNKKKVFLFGIFIVQIVIIGFQNSELNLVKKEKDISEKFIDSLTKDCQETKIDFERKKQSYTESINNLNETIINQKKEIEKLNNILSNKGIGSLSEENPYQHSENALWPTEIKGYKAVGNPTVIYQGTDTTFISYGYKFTLDSVYLALQYTDYYRLGSSVDFVLTAADETYLIIPVSVEGKFKYDSYRYPFQTKNIVAKTSVKRKWTQYELRWIKQHYDTIASIKISPWRYRRYGSKSDCSNHQRIRVSDIPGCEYN